MFIAPNKKSEVLAIQNALWKGRFDKLGHAWGTATSRTGVELNNDLFRRGGLGKIFEIGAGTFRDAVALADIGHVVHGIELTEEGVKLGKELAKERLNSVTRRNLKFHQGDFADSIHDGRIVERSFDGGLSHRLAHLLEEFQVYELADRSARWLKDGAPFFISARNLHDFNSDQMRWIEKGKIAAYNAEDRQGQILRYWDAEDFHAAFREDFEITGVLRDSEMESVDNQNVLSHFTLATAIRRQRIIRAVPPETETTGLSFLSRRLGGTSSSAARSASSPVFANNALG